MKKPSLKDKLLSAAAIEEAHLKLTRPAAPPPVTAAPPPEQPAKPEIEAETALSPRARPAPLRRGAARESATAYPERNVRITVDVPESLHERMKLHTVLQKQSIRDFVLTLVEREIARK